MPFGYSLAPCTFAKCLESVLGPHRRLRIRILFYLGDILVLSRSEEAATSQTSGTPVESGLRCKLGGGHSNSSQPAGGMSRFDPRLKVYERNTLGAVPRRNPWCAQGVPSLQDGCSGAGTLARGVPMGSVTSYVTVFIDTSLTVGRNSRGQLACSVYPTRQCVGIGGNIAGPLVMGQHALVGTNSTMLEALGIPVVSRVTVRLPRPPDTSAVGTGALGTQDSHPGCAGSGISSLVPVPAELFVAPPWRRYGLGGPLSATHYSVSAACPQSMSDGLAMGRLNSGGVVIDTVVSNTIQGACSIHYRCLLREVANFL